MKKIWLLLVVPVIFLSTCKKEKSDNGDYLEYLSDKGVFYVTFEDDIMWVGSYIEKNKENIDLRYISSFQLVKVENDKYSCRENIPEIYPFKMKDGNLYGLDSKYIYEINDINSFDNILKDDTLNFYYADGEDKNNFWFCSQSGIGYKKNDKTSLIFKTDITKLELIPLLYYDENKILWAFSVTLMSNSLLKITDNSTQEISYEDIGLDSLDLIKKITSDQNNDLIILIYDYSTGDNKLLRYINNSWIISDLPYNKTGLCSLKKDENNVIWYCNTYNIQSVKSLYYLYNDEWKNIEVDTDTATVLCVQVHNDKLYVGTNNGLIIQDFTY